MDCEFYAFYPREGQENKSQEEIDQCAQSYGGHLLFLRLFGADSASVTQHYPKLKFASMASANVWQHVLHDHSTHSRFRDYYCATQVGVLHGRFGGRHYMDVFMRQHMRMNSSEFQFPKEGSIYDYCVEMSTTGACVDVRNPDRWVPWMDTDHTNTTTPSRLHLSAGNARITQQARAHDGGPRDGHGLALRARP